MDTSIMLFTRDLRLHDNPAFAAACRAGTVVPLFVFDDALLSRSPNRARFLLDALDDLRASLRARGGGLLLRRGDPAEEAVRVARQAGAGEIHLAGDVSGHASRRLARLEELAAAERIGVTAHPGLTVVPPGDLRPGGGGDHYRVFGPYWRAWSDATWRPLADLPGGLSPVEQADGVELDAIARAFAAGASPDLAEGGETAGRKRAHAWLRDLLGDYDGNHDDLAGELTSQLSPYLRFGCVSPLELAAAARREGGEPFARQLAWRDFLYQVTAAFPAIGRRDYRPRDGAWHDDEDALAAWREGRTGFPIVDAGMRQLAREGRMHNRARMITASFLTRNLRVDWRHGLAHFDRLLADGDLANDAGNWQWVAGTGNDTRPNRVLNPLRQAARFDPSGAYVRRHVPELAGLDAGEVHRPWELPPDRRAALAYPPPLLDTANGKIVNAS
ncbi:cryptochrome/photolyase family protein [Actinomadura parmotrematis]|uniref:DNA photolyase family protein n=1 Tax=Actinomadura parmotrematis TaxID=2864039 RepID=A0ABS7FLY3_9ACTN|nr:deoxyribodipyrimidine photo-lyase [Actinomadura parmotrematis]MBW8481369.1 DNA photolyase family protein [Actinomadura parmotrematis]